jgi:hypothetical protein
MTGKMMEHEEVHNNKQDYHLLNFVSRHFMTQRNIFLFGLKEAKVQNI